MYSYAKLNEYYLCRGKKYLWLHAYIQGHIHAWLYTCMHTCYIHGYIHLSMDYSNSKLSRVLQTFLSPFPPSPFCLGIPKCHHAMRYLFCLQILGISIYVLPACIFPSCIALFAMLWCCVFILLKFTISCFHHRCCYLIKQTIWLSDSHHGFLRVDARKHTYNYNLASIWWEV